MNEKDRRVKRTKKLLKESLAELLLEKNIHNITVRELTDHADISRGAFYSHYEDIYDLYDQMENELLEEIGSIMVEDPSNSYENLYTSLLNYVQNNASVCRVFMCGPGGGTAQKKLMNLMEARYDQIVLYEMKTSEMKQEWRYLDHYFTAGFVALLQKWLESDFSFPKERLLELIMAIDTACDQLYE